VCPSAASVNHLGIRSSNTAWFTNTSSGGGIYNDSGTLIATSSTLDHNTSTGTAGGLNITSGSTIMRPMERH
jgi:hypothetical protein